MTLGGVLVVLFAAGAAWLLTPGAVPLPRELDHRPGDPPPAARQGARTTGWTSSRRLAPRLCGLLTRRQALRDARATLEACDLLSAELAAGRPPGAALDLAARHWPPLAPVAEAFTLGADVPDALRRVAASRPGAADLRLVAGAWAVAQESGRGLATAVERVGRGIRARRRTRTVVESELASARATARLVAVLPFAALVMGSGAGGDPWRFLLATPVGWACLVSGGLLLVGGLLWIELIADRAAPP